MDLNAPAITTLPVEISDASQTGRARRMAHQLAQQLRFDEEGCGRTALVTMELATNIVKHAGRGCIYLRPILQPNGAGIEIIAVDKGPGFDLGRCLPDGISTRGTSGNGLGAIRRQSQVFDAYANEQGAVVMARLYRPGILDKRIGVVQIAIEATGECGDTWRVAQRKDGAAVLVIDGLGHGPDAAKAADLGADAFEQKSFTDAAQLMAELHAAMSGSRGGAVAIAHYDAGADLLRYAGIGNIASFLVNPSQSRGLASHPGIVGVQFRKVQAFETAGVRGDVLIMHSDGIQTRWNLRAYPGIFQCHPAIIAAILHRDFCRGRDDATVVVVPLGALP